MFLSWDTISSLHIQKALGCKQYSAMCKRFNIYCSKQLYFWIYFMVLEKPEFDLESQHHKLDEKIGMGDSIFVLCGNLT